MNMSKEQNVSSKIWVNDCSAGGINIYLVMRGQEVYDQLNSTKRLTWAEQNDVARYYQEALDSYYKEDA